MKKYTILPQHAAFGFDFGFIKVDADCLVGIILEKLTVIPSVVCLFVARNCGVPSSADESEFIFLDEFFVRGGFVLKMCGYFPKVSRVLAIVKFLLGFAIFGSFIMSLCRLGF